MDWLSMDRLRAFGCKPRVDLGPRPGAWIGPFHIYGRFCGLRVDRVGHYAGTGSFCSSGMLEGFTAFENARCIRCLRALGDSRRIRTYRRGCRYRAVRLRLLGVANAGCESVRSTAFEKSMAHSRTSHKGLARVMMPTPGANEDCNFRRARRTGDL